MRVKRGGCRMPIGMCSDYRDKDCGKFCYYNTVEVKSKGDCLRSMTDEELAHWIAWLCQRMVELNRAIEREPDERGWLDWLREEAN